MRTVDEVESTSLPLRLAALFHDVGKPDTRGINPATGDFTFHDHEIRGAEITDNIMRRLKFPNELRERVVNIVRFHLVVYSEAWSDAAVRRWLTRVTPSAFPNILDLAQADIAAKGTATDVQVSDLKALAERVQQMLASNHALTIKDLAVTGHQLMQELDLVQGPLVGRILRALLDDVLEAPERNERERLLESARELLKSFAGKRDGRNEDT